MRRAVLAAAASAALVTGCGGGGLQPPPRDRNPEGFDLEASPRAVRAGGSVQLVVRNRTAQRLEGGVAYRLERWEGGWRWVNQRMAFIQILVVVPPRGVYRQRVDLPDDAEPGLYRVSKDLRSGQRRVRLTARFDVES